MSDTTSFGGAANPRPPQKKKKPNHQARRVFATIGKVLGTLLLVGLCTCVFLACFAAVYIKSVIMPQAYVDIPDVNVSLSTTLYYTDPNTGETKELRTLQGGGNYIPVTYEQLPKYLIDATVAIEDKRFWDHDGVDWYRTTGAFVNMFLGMKNNFGGSTLTQQLIKNATNADENTVQRKILEIFRALEFEKNHDKEDILRLYFNYIYFGGGNRGVGSASLYYFGKPVEELTLAECASLIGITNNPSIYNPYLSERTRAKNKERQEIILEEMCEQGKISEAERDAAKAQELVFQKSESLSAKDPSSVYSYYEDEVIRTLIADLRENLDVSEAVAQQMVYSSGLKVYTCIDPNVQAAVDSVYGDAANLPAGSDSPTGQQLQSAITVLDNTTGNVVAIAGGVGDKSKDGSLSYDRAVRGIRPTGSSIKPLSVYAPAIDLGLITPATVVDDSPFQVLNDAPWPNNVDRNYRGLTTVEYAVENSVNTVAVKVLEMVGLQTSYSFLTQHENGWGGLGISTDHLLVAEEINGKVYSDLDYGPLALGGVTKGLSTLEMAGAYATFPRMGTYIEPRFYTRVEDNQGNLILDNTPDSHVVMKESTAWYVTNMLQGVITEGGGTRARLDGMTAAGKTGTTTSRRDVWFAGYTPYYTAVVWSGYDQQERLDSSLQSTSVILWQKVMNKLHQGLPDQSFPTPSNTQPIQVSLCKDSGLLLTDACRADMRGSRAATYWMLPEDVPTKSCDRHVSITVCKASPYLDENGEPTNRYYLAGMNCPEDTPEAPGAAAVGVLDYSRTGAAALAATWDAPYLIANYPKDECPFHNGETVDPVPIDPLDPATWPDDPNFDPFNPATWPSLPPVEPSHDPNDPNVTDDPTHTDLPAPSHDPAVDPTDPVTPPPEPSTHFPEGIIPF